MAQTFSPSLVPAHTQTPQAADTCQAFVFQIQGYSFALPLGAVIRIVSGRSPHTSAPSQLRLFEGEPLPILDLRPRLAPLPPAWQPTLPGSAADLEDPMFLLIVWGTPTQRCAIAIDQLPQIQALPLHPVHFLPAYYQRQIGYLANHAIVLEDAAPDTATTPTTTASIIFLLDLHPCLAG